MLLIRPDIICFGYDQSPLWKKLLIQFLNNHEIYPKSITLPKYNNGIHSVHLRDYHIKKLDHSNEINARNT